MKPAIYPHECPSCGMPHAASQRASKHGGHGRAFTWRSGDCPVCLSWREDKRDQARPYLVERLTRPSAACQRELGEWE